MFLFYDIEFVLLL